MAKQNTATRIKKMVKRANELDQLADATTLLERSKSKMEKAKTQSFSILRKGRK